MGFIFWIESYFAPQAIPSLRHPPPKHSPLDPSASATKSAGQSAAHPAGRLSRAQSARIIRTPSTPRAKSAGDATNPDPLRPRRPARETNPGVRLPLVRCPLFGRPPDGPPAGPTPRQARGFAIFVLRTSSVLPHSIRASVPPRVSGFKFVPSAARMGARVSHPALRSGPCVSHDHLRASRAPSGFSSAAARRPGPARRDPAAPRRSRARGSPWRCRGRC